MENTGFKETTHRTSLVDIVFWHSLVGFSGGDHLGVQSGIGVAEAGILVVPAIVALDRGSESALDSRTDVFVELGEVACRVEAEHSV